MSYACFVKDVYECIKRYSALVFYGMPAPVHTEMVLEKIRCKSDLSLTEAIR